MGECTETERLLIEAAVSAICEVDKRRASEAQSMQMFGGQSPYPYIPEPLRGLCIAVALERITPERKEALRNAFIKERELYREKARLEAGIPGSIWADLVKEIYPKEEP